MVSTSTSISCILLFASLTPIICQHDADYDTGRSYDYLAFKEFKAKYNKHYANQVDELKHFSAFSDNLKYIFEHNELYKSGNVTFSLGINEFSDMTSDDLAKMRNCFKITDDDGKAETYNPPQKYIPEGADWRTSGAVTEVKRQLQCGACWAFSATGAIEGQHFIKTESLVSLSEQNLIDCATPYGTQGCKSGDMKKAFNYIVANKGIDTEASYPYEAREGQCRFTNKSIGATITGYKFVKKKDEEALKKVVFVIGPIAAAIDANHDSFQHYKSGIYFEKDCSEDNVDHGVLIVGYGVENGEEYWIVKNSYGPDWGENGFIRMARNRGNNCGIASHPIFPTL